MQVAGDGASRSVDDDPGFQFDSHDGGGRGGECIGGDLDGPAASRFVAPAAQLVPMRPTTSFDDAAMTEPLATAVHAVRRAGDVAGAEVLVTGGGGFLGSAICRQLVGLGHRVIAFQRSSAEHLEHPALTAMRGDITDLQALAGAAAGCDAIVHTAGKAGVWGDADDYHRVNVDGTDYTAEVVIAHGASIELSPTTVTIGEAGSRPRRNSPSGGSAVWVRRCG